MQDPGSQNQNPYGGPDHPYNGPNNPYNGPNIPYGGYNPYFPQPLTAKQQPFGGLTTPDERNMAMLAHLLQIFSSFVGPLVLYLVKKDQSKFVAYHALQCLAWHVGYMVFMVGGVFLTIAVTIATGSHGSHGFPIFFIFFLLSTVGMSLLNVVLGVVYAIKAYNGDWGGYPVIGQWVRRFL